MKLLILCLGNDLLGDDGIGLEAAEPIERAMGTKAEVRSTSMSGLYLVELLEGFDDAIVVDSIPGDHPGRIRELTPNDLKPVQVPSAHFVGLPEAIHAARGAGLRVPRRFRILAVEIPIAQTIGASPRPEVRGALPELVRRVTEAAKEWGYV
ncbi:MAG: hydrogenase maturation protease [Candidatus Thermoplasmatota archaeon]|nr:hydrogenase maturation protease [Candidatus Thermoplasmatota archaeon]